MLKFKPGDSVVVASPYNMFVRYRGYTGTVKSYRKPFYNVYVPRVGRELLFFPVELSHPISHTLTKLRRNSGENKQEI